MSQTGQVHGGVGGRGVATSDGSYQKIHRRSTLSIPHSRRLGWTCRGLRQGPRQVLRLRLRRTPCSRIGATKVVRRWPYGKVAAWGGGCSRRRGCGRHGTQGARMHPFGTTPSKVLDAFSTHAYDQVSHTFRRPLACTTEDWNERLAKAARINSTRNRACRAIYREKGYPKISVSEHTLVYVWLC